MSDSNKESKSQTTKQASVFIFNVVGTLLIRDGDQAFKATPLAREQINKFASRPKEQSDFRLVHVNESERSSEEEQKRIEEWLAKLYPELDIKDKLFMGQKSPDDSRQQAFLKVLTAAFKDLTQFYKENLDITLQRYQFYVIADELDIQIRVANFCGFRHAWLNYTPQNAQKSFDLLKTKRVNPDFIWVTLTSLNSLIDLGVQDIDIKYIEEKLSKHTKDEMVTRSDQWRELFEYGVLPSHNRSTYAIVFDQHETKFYEKISIQGMLSERPQYRCIPINIATDDLDAYSRFEIRVFYQKTTNQVANYDTEECTEQREKLYRLVKQQDGVLVDDYDKQFLITDRFKTMKLFKNMHERASKELSETQAKVMQKFKAPLFIKFLNKAQESIDVRLQKYEQSAKEIGLQYPVILKIQQGARVQYAHDFFVVKNSQGMKDALEQDQYKNVKVLCQQYVYHSEQIYKIYAIGDWFQTVIRPSVPDSVLNGVDKYHFDSQVKFDKDSYTKYDDKLSRLNHEEAQLFVQQWAKQSQLSFQGLDIIVDEQTGDYYFIDCNYFSSFKGLQPEYLSTILDEFFLQKLSTLGPIKKPDEPVNQHKSRKQMREEQERKQKMYTFAVRKGDKNQHGQDENNSNKVIEFTINTMDNQQPNHDQNDQQKDVQQQKQDVKEDKQQVQEQLSQKQQSSNSRLYALAAVGVACSAVAAFAYMRQKS